MKKYKRGISLATLSIAMIIMMLIITSTTVFGIRSINEAKDDEYASYMLRLSDNVNVYYTENKVLPTLGDIISSTTLGTKVYDEVVKNGDEANNLYVIDMSKFSDSTLKKSYGLMKAYVFLVAEGSLNVYCINSNYNR